MKNSASKSSARCLESKKSIVLNLAATLTVNMAPGDAVHGLVDEFRREPAWVDLIRLDRSADAALKEEQTSRQTRSQTDQPIHKPILKNRCKI